MHPAVHNSGGKKTETAGTAFSKHDDDAFAKDFASIVQTAYSDLFELHGDAAWDLDKSALITFFRSSDQTTELVGKLQARTFQYLAAFAGHAEIRKVKTRKPGTKKVASATKVKKEAATKVAPVTKGKIAKVSNSSMASKVGLTVRIEINLPADGDQETYDRIFKSIRENLLND